LGYWSKPNIFGALEGPAREVLYGFKACKKKWKTKPYGDTDIPYAICACEMFDIALLLVPFCFHSKS